jgi:hypothetical protein
MLSKKALAIDVEHPVEAPASLTRRPEGVDRRSAASIPVGVGMEHRFQHRLEVSSDDFLGDAVGDRRDAQRPRSAARLRYVHSAHRRRHVTAGR